MYTMSYEIWAVDVVLVVVWSYEDWRLFGALNWELEFWFHLFLMYE